MKNIKNKTIFLLTLCIFAPIRGMESTEITHCHDVAHYRDEWTFKVALSDTRTKNTVRSVCKVLKDISSKNNLDLYACNPIVLSESQMYYALGLAMYKRCFNVVKNLCKNGAKKNNTYLGETLVNLAYYNDSTMIPLKELNIAPETPHYFFAAFFGDMEYLQTYCENTKNDILKETVSCDKTSKPDASIQSSCNILQTAARYGHLNVIQLLLKHPLIEYIINNYTFEHSSALSKATCNGHFTIAQLLFAHPKANHEIYNNQILTPLYAACQFGHEDLVQFFIEKKPEWLNITYQSHTPLHAATYSGFTHIMEILLKSKPDLLEGRVSEYTPLCSAVSYGQYNATLLLCQYGANKNATALLGLTPLIIASEKNHIHIAQLLLTYTDDQQNIEKVDVNAYSFFRKTALDYALTSKNQELTTLLRCHGAKTFEELTQENS
jgi:ankyrin repeat protein